MCTCVFHRRVDIHVVLVVLEDDEALVEGRMSEACMAPCKLRGFCNRGAGAEDELAKQWYR